MNADGYKLIFEFGSDAHTPGDACIALDVPKKKRRISRCNPARSRKPCSNTGLSKRTYCATTPRLNARLTFATLGGTLWPMKAAIYLTDPAEMRKARLNQPSVSSEQARRQRELLQRAAEKFSEDARKGTSSRGRVSKAA
jgi:hypothetical protein